MEKFLGHQVIEVSGEEVVGHLILNLNAIDWLLWTLGYIWYILAFLNDIFFYYCELCAMIYFELSAIYVIYFPAPKPDQSQILTPRALQEGRGTQL